VLKFNLIQSPPYPEAKMDLRVSRTLAHSKREHYTYSIVRITDTPQQPTRIRNLLLYYPYLVERLDREIKVEIQTMSF
jgi:hypothetical protein